MRIFSCPSCGGVLYFHNLRCTCGTEVVWSPGSGGFLPMLHGCTNRERIRCNWEATAEGRFCHACAMTTVVPDLAVMRNLGLWAEAEEAKRWVLATLARWGWFGPGDLGPRPVFHLLAEETRAGFVPVTMGHAAGVVTINVSESDHAETARRRQELGEPYRTMMGHFRHELAHVLFDRLASRDGFLDGARALFGDERQDYAAALATHYEWGAPPDWAVRHVTAYASAHPFEDWAETLAHLLHLTDLTDSVAAAGLSGTSLPPPGYDAYAETDARRLIAYAVDLGIALNHVNRTMGLSDLYPFVLSPASREKLAFVHHWLKGASAN